MDHDFVDDGLREQRGGKPHELDGKRCQQHIAPDALVLQQLRDEPAETELTALRLFGCFLVASQCLFLGPLQTEQHGQELQTQVGKGDGLRRFASGIEQQDALAVGLENQRRRAAAGARQCQGRQAVGGKFLARGHLVLADVEPQQLRSLAQRRQRIRRRKPLQDQPRVERDAK